MPDRQYLLVEATKSKENRDKLFSLLQEAEKSAYFDLVDYLQGLIDKFDNNYGSAIEHFKKALSNSPEDPDILDALSDAYLSVGNNEEAINLLLKCLEYSNEKNNPYMYKYKVGLIYKKSRKYKEAMTYFAKSIENKPDFFESYIEICRCAFVLKNLEIFKNYSDVAFEKFKNINEKRVQLSKMLNTMGRLYFERNEFEPAINCLDKAISLDRNPTFYANKGLCLTKLSRHPEALKEYKEALSLDPNHAYAFYNMALTFKELDNKHEVIVNLIEAIKRENVLFERVGKNNFLTFLGITKCEDAGEFIKLLSSKLLDKVPS